MICDLPQTVPTQPTVPPTEVCKKPGLNPNPAKKCSPIFYDCVQTGDQWIVTMVSDVRGRPPPEAKRGNRGFAVCNEAVTYFNKFQNQPPSNVL